ncbi:hypothetical protein ACHHRT_09045 [Desulfurivibrio sp. D14AmB]|uniref:hypothetical protein n=1 Tax=Desulfurivibrio sp. D14AmB TaxID=3374370 RepID=UPI00376EBCAB
MVNYSEKHFEEQEEIRLENTIASFFSDFQVGHLLNGAGIRKLRGAWPLKGFAAIFRLPLAGKNFYRSIVEQDDLGFGKDAAYALLRNPRHNWRRLMLGGLYALLTKRPGRARILAAVNVETRQGQQVRIVFVRHRHKRDWLAVLPTRVDLADEEIVRIYGKRWDIEVCFKMLKPHLRLEKEAQLRDYDGLIGHLTVVMTRYMFLSFRQRLHSDQRTAGSLFHACCEEVRDLTLLDAMQRLMTLVIDRIRATGELPEDVISKMIDAMMGAMAEIMETIRRSHSNKYGIVEG